MSKLIGLEEFLKLKNKFKEKKIVFTNGCFDLLHVGHVDYLTRAKQLGDILIIGLNSDSSVKKIKGSKRPLNNEKDRATVLAALECVDFIILFEEDTPYRLIQAIQPDVLVKGGDWPIDRIVGKDIVEANGGQVISLSLIEGYSTTNLINKIIKLYS
ncbi:MAG: D-glycero-beta-D-manno-heptose 1-phosphate adenylyltransferase [Desulfonauticus sp.]|nr:D-glycero-beta-D-manno-heptose 1-phosphate adenylyltransferase [Desulfonauticus sp.]